MRISPSIASSNLVNIEQELIKIGEDYDNLHIDIEDGNFVDNITFGLKTIKSIRLVTDKPFSVHLMVTKPENYLDELFQLGCSHIFIHGESTQYLRKLILKVKRNGVKAGLALNPLSNIRTFEHLYDDLDAILYLTSEIDGYGEKFQSQVLKKVLYLNTKEIWIDGGINFDNMKLLPKSIDYVVMGRAIFNHENASLVIGKTY